MLQTFKCRINQTRCTSYKYLYVLIENYRSKNFELLFVVVIGRHFRKICSRGLLKTGGHLIKCQIIVKFVGRILYWSLNAGGHLFQVVIRTGLTVLPFCHLLNINRESGDALYAYQISLNL